MAWPRQRGFILAALFSANSPALTAASVFGRFQVAVKAVGSLRFCRPSHMITGNPLDKRINRQAFANRASARVVKTAAMSGDDNNRRYL